MGIFKDLLSRHLLGRPRPTPPPALPAHRHSIGEELPYPCCCAAAAAASGGKKNQQRVLPLTHPEFIRVQRMAGDLIAAACHDANYGRRRLSPTIRRPFRGIKWTVGVVDARYVNGFSTETGSIYVSTGLLGHLRHDAAVAAVLRHEVGHVIARHIGKLKRNWFLSGFLAYFAGELLDAPPGDKATREQGCGIRSLFMRPCYYSQEYEADRLGLLLLAAAGYDPRAGPWVYRKLGEIGELAPDDLRSMHPASAKRVERLSQGMVMDEATELFSEATRHGNS
ncbi:unnamed protein product [Urochloa decumbens]|uniref:Peptidase M48 domain-containing protein n=1 Tax=Urochloa decumbens TaxID=240449 RepID=A0ABC9BRC2_9POAL